MTRKDLLIQEAARIIARHSRQRLDEAKKSAEMTAFFHPAQVMADDMEDVAPGTIQFDGQSEEDIESAGGQHITNVLDHLHDKGYMQQWKINDPKKGINHIDDGNFESFVVRHGSQAHQDQELMGLLRKLPSRKAKSFTNPYKGFEI